jgi:hypothetical protein
MVEDEHERVNVPGAASPGIFLWGGRPRVARVHGLAANRIPSTDTSFGEASELRSER